MEDTEQLADVDMDGAGEAVYSDEDYDEEDQAEDDEEEGGEDGDVQEVDDDAPVQALPVKDTMTAAELEAAILAGPPQSAEEYLMRVRYEASGMPDVFVATRAAPTVSESKRQHESAKLLTAATTSAAAGTVSSSRSADPEWQASVVADFSQLRLNIARQRATTQSTGLPAGVPALSKPEAWRQLIATYPPSGQLMQALDHVSVNALVVMLANWITETPKAVDRLLGMWFYSVLACLDKPVDPDVMADIRDACRRCIAIRDSLSAGQDEEVARLNTLVTIVVGYFRQADLEA